MSHSTVPGAAGAANPSRASTFAAVLSGLRISPAAFVAGQVVSAASHYWADRRFTLAQFAARTGKVRIWVRTNRGASAQATW